MFDLVDLKFLNIKFKPGCELSQKSKGVKIRDPPSGVFRNLETGGHIDGHKKFDDFFGKLTSVDLF
jgi:hypothetical protein